MKTITKKISGAISKKLIILSFVLYFNILFAQEKEKPGCFSNFEFGTYGGINFDSFSEIGSTFICELKTNLLSSLYLKLSLGYSKSFMLTSYNVKRYVKFSFDTTTSYQAMNYDVIKKGYDVFPILLGFQYVFKYQTLSPYLLFDLSYNSIVTKIFRSPAYIWTYDSFDKLPDEYKTKYIETLPKTSYGIAFGIGAIYQISHKLNLDFRYFYKFDKDIVKTHQFIAGVTF